MDTELIWDLNFAADDELAGEFSTDASSLRAKSLDLEGVVRRLGLVLPHHRVLGPRTGTSSSAGAEGRAFCPTPRALARLGAAGARVPRAPPLDVLKRVNDRAFVTDLARDLRLEGSTWVDSKDAALGLLESSLDAESGSWLAKRRFGYAGRGQRRIDAKAVTPADSAFLAATCARQGGLVLEPRVAIDREFALHGHIAADGGVTVFGEPTVQDCDPRRVWRGTPRCEGELAESEGRTFAEAAQVVAQALFGAGYFGPFGIDGYRYIAASGPVFVPVSEVNARYTMGWAVGMGALRPDLP